MSRRVIHKADEVTTLPFAETMPTLSVVGGDLQGKKGAIPPRRLSGLERMQLEAQEKGHKEGYRAGYEEGLKLGHAEGHKQAYDEVGAAGHAEVQRFAAELNEVTAAVMEAIKEWYVKAEDSLSLLAIVIAERIIRREVRASNEVILSITRDALMEVTHSARARVRINPFDSALLSSHKEQLMAIAPSLKDVEIVSDSSIQGGCVIETDGGLIDAQISSKLQAIIEAAKGVA